MDRNLARSFHLCGTALCYAAVFVSLSRWVWVCSPEPHHHSCQESASMLGLIPPFLEIVDYNGMQSCRAMSQLAHGVLLWETVCLWICTLCHTAHSVHPSRDDLCCYDILAPIWTHCMLTETVYHKCLQKVHLYRYEFWKLDKQRVIFFMYQVFSLLTV